MAQTFGPAEILGNNGYEFSSPGIAPPAAGCALVAGSGSGTQYSLGWTLRPVLMEPAVGPLNSNQYLAADRTWKSIPPIDSGSVVGALGFTPVNRAGDTMSGNLRVSTVGGASVVETQDFGTFRMTYNGGERYRLHSDGAGVLHTGLTFFGNEAGIGSPINGSGKIRVAANNGLEVINWAGTGRSVNIEPNWNGFQARISASTGQIELASVDSNALVSGNNVYFRSAADGWIHLNDTVTVSKTGDLDYQRSNLGQNHWWRQTVDNGVAGTDGLTLVSMNNSNQFKFRRDGAFQANRFTTNMNADQIEGSAFSGRFRVGSSSGVSVYSTFNDVKLLGSSVAIRNAADNADAPLTASTGTFSSGSIGIGWYGLNGFITNYSGQPIKLSSNTNIQCRNGSDSDFVPLLAGAITASGNFTFNNFAANRPVIKWNSTNSSLGLSLVSNSTEVARFQDNGVLLAQGLGTLGGMQIGDFYLQRGIGGAFVFPDSSTVEVRSGSGRTDLGNLSAGAITASGLMLGNGQRVRWGGQFDNNSPSIEGDYGTGAVTIRTNGGSLVVNNLGNVTTNGSITTSGALFNAQSSWPSTISFEQPDGPTDLFPTASVGTAQVFRYTDGAKRAAIGIGNGGDFFISSTASNGLSGIGMNGGINTYRGSSHLFRNGANSADAPITAGTITASGTLTTVGNIVATNPEGTGVAMRLGAAYGIPGVYSSGSLSILSDTSVISLRGAGTTPLADFTASGCRVAGDFLQGFGAVNASYRSRMIAAGSRASEVGDGAATWQTGYREQFNAGGLRCSFFGATPVAQDAGWSVSNYTTKKTFDPTVDNLAGFYNFVCTLAQRVKDLGLVA
jgi:hypothetical protein